MTLNVGPPEKILWKHTDAIQDVVNSFQVHLVPLISGLADEFMSCDRYFESRRESRILENIPCDITKVTYCGQKGPAYPE